MRSTIWVICLAACTAAKPPIEPGDDSGGGKGDGGGKQTGAYVLYEKFDAMATGAAPDGPWTVDTTANSSVLVREVPFAADKSAEIAKPAGTGSASLAATFAPQTGRIVFEAKVLARETAGFKAIPYIYDASGAAVASVAFQDGMIATHVGAATVQVQPFAANLWYRVRIVVDLDAATFDLFIDGVRKQQGQALRMAASAVGKVRYYVDGAGAGTLAVDSVRVYTEAAYIGAAPSPVYDVRDYGAVGDGKANDQAAIQKAIDAAAGTGGSVLLAKGTYLSGTLNLASGMTFFIAPSATLLGSTKADDYPAQSPSTGNTQLSNCRRALLYANQVDKVAIDGGGMIDGQGDPSNNSPENTRPMVIWTVLSTHVTVQNVSLRRGAVWSLVSMESDHVIINNVNVNSDGITHDGIDIVDGSDVMVENATVRSGDDAMCLKSGVRRGIDGMTVRDSLFSGSGDNGGSNGIKFGTATYGGFHHIAIEDTYVKDVQYAAMALESRQGSDVDGVTFQRVEFAHTGAAFFVYLAQQATTHPIGDVPKLGSITNVSFTDIAGTTASWPHSPHQGSLIPGHIFNGTTYPITNLSFTNVAISFTGGSVVTPASPDEAKPNQYPESNMFGDLPAWGYYLRHVSGVTFTNCRSAVASPDVRQPLVTDDVSGLLGTP